MCTAFEIAPDASRHEAPAVADFLRALAALPARLIRPTLEAPVLLPDGAGTTMSWGFRREFASKQKGRPTIRRTIVNSREDKLGGPVWREAFRERRCLIPATSYFEWTDDGGRAVPLRFQRPDFRWLWIAGIWEESPIHGRCFSMITTDPTATIATVHDRMPAVLPEHLLLPYLRGEVDRFGPSEVPLSFSTTPNFLKPPPAQGELF